MSLPLTRKSVNHSTTEQFAFSFFCDRCGKEFRSEIVPFNQGYFTAIEHEEVRQLLWAQEHKTAFEQANVDARMKFSLCPQCGRRICDECLSLDSRQEADLCKDCV
jgi:predicted RNA-binding Zn-ribbon protein involved in translation (DUF1610 family)